MVPSLTREDLVVGHPGGTYSLGLRVAILASRFGAIEQLRAAARPVLSELRDRTGESANLLVCDGDDAVYVEQAESQRSSSHGVDWPARPDIG